MSLDFYFDIATGRRVQSPAYALPSTDTPSGKLMSTQPVRIQYLSIRGNAGTPVAAPSNTIRFGLKLGTVASGNYSDPTFDVYTDSFTPPADPTLATAFYTAPLTIDSVALRALFPVTGNGSSAGAVNLIGEVLSGNVPTETFTFQVVNNVIKNNESPAVAQPGPSGYPDPATVNAAVAQAANPNGGTAAAAGQNIQLRHGTNAQWIAANPVLLAGEVGVETDTGKQKFGDGITHWTSLAYSYADTQAGNVAASFATFAYLYPSPVSTVVYRPNNDALNALPGNCILVDADTNGAQDGAIQLPAIGGQASMIMVVSGQMLGSLIAVNRNGADTTDISVIGQSNTVTYFLSDPVSANWTAFIK